MKEIVFGRDLYKEIKQFLPCNMLVREKRQANGLIKLGIYRKFQEQDYGIMPMMVIGKDAPFKMADLKDLCVLACEKIEEKIKEKQDE